MAPSQDFVRARPMLAGAVASAVGYRGDGFVPGVHRGLPSSYLTFILSFDSPVTALADPHPDAPVSQRAQVVLAGLHREPVFVEQPRRQEGIQLSVHPLAARALFGLPTAEIPASEFDAEPMLGKPIAELRDRVAEARTWSDRFSLVQDALQTRMAEDALAPRAELFEAWRWMRVRRGTGSIDALARHLGFSTRQLGTLFRRELGQSPKSVSRLIRFESAVSAIVWRVSSGQAPDFAGIAQSCGYYDQPHLVREFREFAGTSPTEWVAEEFRNIQAGGHRNGEDGLYGHNNDEAGTDRLADPAST